MNFLAHAYLSFDNEDVLVGNMISDFVKGNRQLDYPPGIRAGILLHRMIDTFTDEHPVTIAAKQVFRATYRLYSGAFMDVVYDYFLATDKTEFSPESLHRFARNTYETLERYTALLPENFRQLFYYMKQQDWLYNYREPWGIYKSFAGLVRRAAYLNDSRPAEKIFEAHREPLGDSYRLFWADLKPFAAARFATLIN
ncbi:ACP phosphodiesterase [Niabella beijingensis]|uniref:acyl carrier protein phosphodiesterase n=1 Tax=Niabella beijingensis TaxID=2872700 RepID=UPI001CBCE913|nr:ACP phosphodiesterase [Niabella beijingensis]MBZ4189569.1 ACP phosphodiesterase [Niabella beijingensis]